MASLSGTSGNDLLNGTADKDTISGLGGDDTIHGLEGNDSLNGGSGNDLLYGDDGNDVLNGGIGIDTMRGGAGDDTYVVDDAGDLAIEGSSAGIDLVKASVTWKLVSNLENLTLTGTAAIDGTGNSLANILTGNSASNILNGLGGADRMKGGGGDDTYIVDNVGDVLVEGITGGTDLVKSSVSWKLGSNLENLILIASAANGTGNGLDNHITGNSAANILNGMAGADTMSGGAGDDTYVVDNAGDIAIETSATGGTDLVKSSVSFALGARLENLTLTGTAAIDGTGNSLDNVIVGNNSANVIDGGAGADKMTGRSGDDIYMVDNVGDRAIETSASGGVDLVESSVSFTLGANIENLTLLGAAAINGTGNSLNNTITGNSGDNILWGLAGNDTIRGQEGTDQLYGGAGSDALNGGAGDDTLYGEDGDDSLSGDDGLDTLYGGDGNDYLTAATGDLVYGGLGNDTYHVVTSGSTITENSGEGTDLVEEALDSFTLPANFENGNILYDGAGYQTLYGNEMENQLSAQFASGAYLYGLGGNDTLYAGGGVGNAFYFLYGGDGNDSLHGGEGIDTLQGDAGADNLWGGGTGDTFKYVSVSDSAPGSYDQIFDFYSTSGEGAYSDDQLDLSAIDADTTVAGDQAFFFNPFGSPFHTPADLSASVVTNGDSSQDVIFYGDTNGDGIADLEIHVHSTTTLNLDDITL